jgi:RNA polymerase sigma factor (sigma-70 family)
MDNETRTKTFIDAYDQYADELYRFCLFKVSDPERAQDIVQDVFTRYWQTVRMDTAITYPRALLFTIARNRITDWYRKKKEDSLDQLTDGGMEVEGGAGVDIEKAASYEEILRAVETLDEPFREVILLRFTEGWSPAEIAALTNETPNAVSVRLNRAIKKLQDRLRI